MVAVGLAKLGAGFVRRSAARAAVLALCSTVAILAASSFLSGARWAWAEAGLARTGSDAWVVWELADPAVQNGGRLRVLDEKALERPPPVFVEGSVRIRKVGWEGPLFWRLVPWAASSAVGLGFSGPAFPLFGSGIGWVEELFGLFFATLVFAGVLTVAFGVLPGAVSGAIGVLGRAPEAVGRLERRAFEAAGGAAEASRREEEALDAVSSPGSDSRRSTV